MLAEEKFEGFEGTVKPADEYDAELDAKRFYDAVSGTGTDEDQIMRLVSRRSNLQLKDIAEAFKASFGEELLDKLKSDLSGNLEKVVVKRFYNRHELAAMRCREAMKGSGTDEGALSHQIVSKLPADIEAMKAAFEEMYEGRELEKDVKGETGGDYEKFLVSILTAGRASEDEEVDRQKAAHDARELYEAGEGKWGTDESTFNMILSTRSWKQLVLTFEEYQNCSEKTMEEAVKSEMGGKLEQAQLFLCAAARNLPKYYADRIKESMKGLGTDDDELIQYIVERCEIDMVQIKEAFLTYHEKELADWIRDDCSGDYEKTLLALIGEYDLGDFTEPDE